MIRVLIVDDSPTARSLLWSIFASDPEFAVVGEATDGAQAVELTRRLRPDVVSMDIRMPRMDGFEATREIMIEAPTPIVLVTGSRAVHEVDMSMHALKAGALAITAKPVGPETPGFEAEAQQLIAQVKAMAQVKVVRHWRAGGQAPNALTAGRSAKARSTPTRLVAIASSTGGPAALESLLSGMPAEFPAPVLIVQHISPGFAKGLADWLDKASPLRVKLAEHDEPIRKGTVYLAPDETHLGIQAPGQIALSNGPSLGGFRPSATHLFQSAAQSHGAGATAVVLTGMGEDGVAGLPAVRRAGGHVLAQDESTSVVFGMPAAAIAAGLADEILPIEAIAGRLAELAQ